MDVALIAKNPSFFPIPLQIIVMIITAGLFGFNLYGTLMMEQFTDQIWFLPPDSMGYKYEMANREVSLMCQ